MPKNLTPASRYLLDAVGPGISFDQLVRAREDGLVPLVSGKELPDRCVVEHCASVFRYRASWGKGLDNRLLLLWLMLKGHSVLHDLVRSNLVAYIDSRYPQADDDSIRALAETTASDVERRVKAGHHSRHLQPYIRARERISTDISLEPESAGDWGLTEPQKKAMAARSAREVGRSSTSREAAAIAKTAIIEMHAREHGGVADEDANDDVLQYIAASTGVRPSDAMTEDLLELIPDYRQIRALVAAGPLHPSVVKWARIFMLFLEPLDWPKDDVAFQSFAMAAWLHLHPELKQPTQ